MNSKIVSLIRKIGIQPQRGTPSVRYDAIQQAFATVGGFAAENNAAVHMPRIGCRLAGRTCGKVEPIVEAELVRLGGW